MNKMFRQMELVVLGSIVAPRGYREQLRELIAELVRARVGRKDASARTAA